MNGQPVCVAARATRRKAGQKGAALIAEGNLEIFSDRLEFKSWRLPVSGVSNACFERRLAKRGGRWLTKSNRLRVTCGGYDYKFRFDALEDLRADLPFPVEFREVQLKSGGPVVWGFVLLLFVLSAAVNGLFS